MVPRTNPVRDQTGNVIWALSSAWLFFLSLPSASEATGNTPLARANFALRVLRFVTQCVIIKIKDLIPVTKRVSIRLITRRGITGFTFSHYFKSHRISRDLVLSCGWLVLPGGRCSPQHPRFSYRTETVAGTADNSPKFFLANFIFSNFRALHPSKLDIGYCQKTGDPR